MQTRLISMKSWLLSGLTAVALSGCAAPSVVPPAPRTESASNQAEKLAREGDPAGAARAYEALAAQSPPEMRNRLLLSAARQYLRSGDADKASAMLNQLGASLPTQDLVTRAQIAATLALRAQRPDKALAELNEIPQPIPEEALSEILALRARALFALNRPAAAVMTALDREPALNSPQERRLNQRLIWEGLQRSASTNADFTAPAGSSSVVVGWLELGRAALIAARNPFAAQPDLAAWRSRYPTHPANAFVAEDVLPELGAGLQYPPQIALILPLSGRQQAEGTAVRDGFLAAHLQQPDIAQRPVVNVYDSAALGAASAYQRAIAEGAQFVVGPLTKPEVTAIAAAGPLPVTTLALNQLADTSAAPSQLFQFALDPEDEARQVAQRLAAEGRMRGLVLLPKDAWGERIYRAFEAELTLLGGTIAATSFYETTARDYSRPITNMLLIDESRARANALNALLGMRLEFEPRRRTDAQFIFVGAFPAQGRSLRPALRFHLIEDVPIYATSHIFEPNAQANVDIDGVIFPNMPLVVSTDAVSSELRTNLSKYWPVRSRSNGGLYAFGFDAYRIIPMLKTGNAGSAYTIPGMTGLLSVDDKGRVRRELEWARISAGKAVPIDNTATASIR